jgi:hypothetical protein
VLHAQLDQDAQHVVPQVVTTPNQLILAVVFSTVQVLLPLMDFSSTALQTLTDHVEQIAQFAQMQLPAQHVTLDSSCQLELVSVDVQMDNFITRPHKNVNFAVLTAKHALHKQTIVLLVTEVII